MKPGKPFPSANTSRYLSCGPNPEIMSKWAEKLFERFGTVSVLSFIAILKVSQPDLIVSNFKNGATSTIDPFWFQ